MSKAVTTVMERWGEIWNEGNLAAVDEAVAADYVEHSSLRGDMRGREAVKESYQRYHSAFPDMHFTLIDRVVEGDKVAQRWSFQGTHKGEWIGVAATGKPVTYTGGNTFRIAGGRIAETWTNWDMGAFLQQVGRAPAASAASKAVAERWLREIWNRGDLGLIDEIVASDYVHHSPLEEESRGRDTVRRGYRNWRAAFPDLRMTLLDAVAEGDKVVHYMRVEGTHRGEWNGVDVTGKRVSYTGTVMFRIADGKVAETWTHWNTMGWLKQVGRTIS